MVDVDELLDELKDAFKDAATCLRNLTITEIAGCIFSLVIIYVFYVLLWSFQG